jgi:hypothetical protein
LAVVERHKPSWDHVLTKKPTNDKKRGSFMQLMPRHIAWVEELAHRPERRMSPGRPAYDREFTQYNFTENYTRFFTPLRGSLAKAVLSDELRIAIMISSLLNLVDERRRQLEEDSAYVPVVLDPIGQKKSRSKAALRPVMCCQTTRRRMPSC